MNNYRPISVISCFAKVFEKCLKEKITEYLESNNLLYNKQFGFRNNRNTEDAIIDLVKEIHSNLRNKKKSLAIFMDLSKAFDTVSHEILFERLEEVGIRGEPLNLLINYLSNRSQCVKVNDIFSETQIIKTGVPQGTVLGPLLFLIYINNIGKIFEECSVIAYADDTALLFSGNSWDEVYEQAERGVKALYSWLSDGLLALNFTKTFFMTFSASLADQPTQTTIKIHNPLCTQSICNCPQIERVDKMKYLGIFLDQNLKWDEHLAFLNKKIRNIFYKFFQLREILNKQMLKIVYYSLVESNLRYCITVWGGAYNNVFRIVMTCQNLILKIMYRKPFNYHSTDLYKNCDILKVRNLYVHAVINYIIKVGQNQIENRFYNTRHADQNNLPVPLMRSDLCQRFYTYYGPKLFNELPNDIKNQSDSRRFKKITREFLLQDQEYFDDLF